MALKVISPLGTVALVGGAPAGIEASLGITELLDGRSVRGVVQGDAVPQVFVPQPIEHFRAGRSPFDRLVRSYDFADITQAIDDMGRGTTIKPVLRIGSFW